MLKKVVVDGGEVFIDVVSLQMVREKQVSYLNKLDTSEITSKLCIEFIGNKVQENLLVLCMNAKNEVTHASIVHIGTLSTCTVSVADILRIVLLAGTPKFIIAHNHPSGDLTASSADIQMTHALKQSADTMQIHMLDALIVNNRDYYSFAVAGNL